MEDRLCMESSGPPVASGSAAEAGLAQPGFELRLHLIAQVGDGLKHRPELCRSCATVQ